MLHHAIRLGHGHQRIIHLIAHKSLRPLNPLVLHAHRGPHVGENHIRILCRLKGVGSKCETGIGDGFGKIQHLLVGGIAAGAGNGDIHTALKATHNNGICHIVAVTHIADLQALQLGLVLPDSHKIRQHLAGMAEVGEAVDDGDRAVFRQILHLLLGKGADHDAVAVAADNPCGILHRLPPANLADGVGEKQCVASQLEHPYLEGYPGAGRVFGEDHGQGLALQDLMGDTVLLVVLELVRQIQDLIDLLPTEIQQFQQVLVFHGALLTSSPVP